MVYRVVSFLIDHDGPAGSRSESNTSNQMSYCFHNYKIVGNSWQEGHNLFLADRDPAAVLCS